MIFTVKELEEIRNVSKTIAEDIGLTKTEMLDIKKRSNNNIVDLLQNFSVTYSLFKSIGESEKISVTTKQKIKETLSQFPYINKIKKVLIKHSLSYEKEREEIELLSIIGDDIILAEDFINTVFVTTKVLSDDQPDFQKFNNQNLGGVFD